MHTVLVPPLLCSPRIYDAVIPAAWAFGSVSVADTRGDDTMTGMAERLLVDAPDRFALVGTSMGGYVALETVRQAPERVSALVLISTSARADPAAAVAARRAQSDAARKDFAGLADAAFPALVAAGHESDPQLLALWRTMAAEVGPEAFLRQQEAVISRADARELLPRIACPTAVIHGTGDRLIDVAMAYETASLVPAATLTLIDGAGHLAVQEQPDPVIVAVSELLARA